MRITSGTVTRRYLRNLELNYSGKNESENKIASNKKFTRASQNPINAAKALKVRKAMSELSDYKSNLNTAKSIYETAESAVMTCSELIQNSYEKLVYGADGTLGDAEDEILADTLEQFGEEMIKTMNLVVADRKIFGGVNNQTLAFTVEDNASGKTVKYNGVSVNEYQEPSMFPQSSASYSDIGIGMTLLEDGTIDPQSALQVTFNGAEVMGCGLKSKINTFDLANMYGEYSLDVTVGETKKTIAFTADGTADSINEALAEAFGDGNLTVGESGVLTNNILGSGSGSVTVANTPLLDPSDANYTEYEQANIQVTPTGYSDNIIQLVYDAAACLRSHDKLGAAKFADQLFASQTNLSLSIAGIGNREEFIDFNLERLTNNEYSLSEQQNDLEGADLGVEITNWKVMEAIYNATLQMSTSVVPMSIFNFM